MAVLNDGQQRDELSVDINAFRALERVFVAAVLLTGSVAKGESSILEGIATLPDGEASETAVLYAALNAAIASPFLIGRQSLDTQDFPAIYLPAELRDVLLLPDALRQPFVLRLLVGLPLGDCSRLLSMDACEIQKNTVSAAIELSGGKSAASGGSLGERRACS
jgi:hypothetical protein